MTEDDGAFELVDPHVHWWDRQAHHDWYRPPTQTDESGFGIGDTTALGKDYLLDDYRRDTSEYRVSGIVHVTAVEDAFEQESAWLEDMSGVHGVPNAIVSSVDPGGAWPDIAASFDRQGASPLFRGVRVLSGLSSDDPSARKYLDLLDERGWIYDAVAHTETLGDLSKIASQHPGLQIVLEHAGWPLQAGRQELSDWKTGMARLAGHENVVCKISGLAMTLHTFDAETLRPWVSHCLDVFGPDRAMFASNFPVDRLFGSYRELFGSYRKLAGGLTPDEQRRVFVTNAQRFYRI